MIPSPSSAFSPFQRGLSAAATPFQPRGTSPLSMLPPAVYAECDARITRRHRLIRELAEPFVPRVGLEEQIHSMRQAVLETLESARGFDNLAMRVHTVRGVLMQLQTSPYLLDNCVWFQRAIRNALENCSYDAIQALTPI